MLAVVVGAREWSGGLECARMHQGLPLICHSTHNHHSSPAVQGPRGSAAQHTPFITACLLLQMSPMCDVN